MPLIRYEGKKFGPDAMDIIAQAQDIFVQYAKEGYDLTLRQLYYRFVAKAYFANKESNYKKLGKIINDARLAGYLDWKLMVDRTRKTEIPNAWDDPSKIIEESAKIYAKSLWQDQDYYIEAWIEKDALVGVLESASKEMNIPYLSCRGYTSQSEMWKASMRLLGKVREGKKVVILHLGDHDPSGIDMTRDIEDRIQKFVGMDYCRLVADDRGEDPSDMKDVRTVYGEAMDHLEIRRIALTMKQVREFDPPPNPAKVTDSRYAKYVEEYGNESWELDALPPNTLVELVRSNASELIDWKLWQAAIEKQEEEKDALDEASARWDEVVEFLAA